MWYLVRFVAAALGVVFSATLAHSQTAIGKAVSVDDTVTGNGRVISTSATVFANERIQANASGLGHFQFNDGTKLVVGPGTNLVLNELVYNPDGSTFKRFVMDSSAGALRFISGSSDSSAFKINTPIGTLGLRGTAFDIQHLRGRTYIMLVDGRVEFCSLNNTCRTIRRKCDYVVASANGNVSPPVQPRNGIFESRDMARYFPFVSTQANIETEFQLPITSCRGGSGSRFGGGLGANPAAPAAPSNDPD